MSQLTLVVKGTRLCPLRRAPRPARRAEKDQVMPFAVVANVIAKALADPQADAVTFVWHGGETTLLPIDFYRKAVLLQARMRRPGQRILNGLQTNGTRLTPEWAAFFSDNDFHVGVSIDGPAEVHDSARRTVAGRPTLSTVLEGLALLRAYGVTHSVLMVVNEATLALGPDAAFDFMLANGIRHFGVLAVQPVNLPHARPGTPVPNYTDPCRMNRFLIGLYDRWRREGDPTIWIRELGSLQRRLEQRSGGICTLAGGCLGSNFIIAPNGAVAHCDFFLGDPAYVFGNITRQSFEDLRRSERMTSLIREIAAALERMSACPECGGGRGGGPRGRGRAGRRGPGRRDS